MSGKELVSEWEETGERNFEVYVLWGQIHKAYFCAYTTLHWLVFMYTYTG